MVRIKSPQDIGAAAVFIVIGLVGLYFGKDLRFGTGARMGPGFFPYYLSWSVIAVGAIIGARALVLDGPPIERIKLRPVIAIILSLLVFGFAMDVLGLVFSAFVLILIAAFAQEKPNIRGTVLLGAGMTVFCVVVFVWALGQPLTLFGN
jgi:hypothetical protein